MILTVEFDLESVKTNQHSQHLGQRSFSAKVIARTHTPDRLLYVGAGHYSGPRICYGQRINMQQTEGCKLQAYSYSRNRLPSLTAIYAH